MTDQKPPHSAGWIILWVLIFWPVAVWMLIQNNRAQKDASQ